MDHTWCSSDLEQFADKVLDYSNRYNSRNHMFYSPANLSGKYTQYPSYGDFPETYTLRAYGAWWNVSEATHQKPYSINDSDPLGAEDFVTVHFNQAVLPSKIYVYETYNPGAVVRIWGRRGRTDNWTLLWEGPPQKCPPQARKFQPELNKVTCFIDTIRLELNCLNLEHNACLDAVLLTGKQMPESIFQQKCFEAFKLPQEKLVESKHEEALNYFKRIPYEVIVHIFKFLDLKSLTRCARVSKQWNEITKDPLLYQHISLKMYWYTVDSRALDFLQDKCKSLRKLDLSWCGNDDPSFTRKFYQFFTTTCQNLTHLSLGNATYINGSHLAALSRCPELIELRLRNAVIADIGFCHVETLSKLTKLVTLDLYSTNITSDRLIALLRANPNLKYINVDFCDEIENLDDVIEVLVQNNKFLTGWSSWKAKRLTSRGISLFGHCRYLEDLDLGWGLHISPPEHALEKIALGCRNLRRLILSGWRPLVDSMLIPLLENCKKLEQLDLLSITGISKEFVERILNELPSLKLLELSFCNSIPMEKVEQWRLMYPNVTIQKCPENDY